jgi:hypothetical protein
MWMKRAVILGEEKIVSPEQLLVDFHPGQENPSISMDLSSIEKCISGKFLNTQKAIKPGRQNYLASV